MQKAAPLLKRAAFQRTRSFLLIFLFKSLIFHFKFLYFLERKSTKIPYVDDFNLGLTFLSMQLSSRSKLRKEACARWQVLFSFARCPASRQLGIVEQIKSLASKQQCLKQSLQRLQLAAHTTDLTTMCAQNPASYKLLLNFIITASNYQ